MNAQVAASRRSSPGHEHEQQVKRTALDVATAVIAHESTKALFKSRHLLSTPDEKCGAFASESCASAKKQTQLATWTGYRQKLHPLFDSPLGNSDIQTVSGVEAEKPRYPTRSCLPVPFGSTHIKVLAKARANTFVGEKYRDFDVLLKRLSESLQANLRHLEAVHYISGLRWPIESSTSLPKSKLIAHYSWIHPLCISLMTWRLDLFISLIKPAIPTGGSSALPLTG
eukprot:4824671-Pleurochrysis_carterae.AAC.1